MRQFEEKSGSRRPTDQHRHCFATGFIDVGHLEAFSLACDELELHEVAVVRGVREATVLAVEIAVLKSGRAQQAGRALAVEVAFTVEPRPGDHRRRGRGRRWSRRSP